MLMGRCNRPPSLPDFSGIPKLLTIKLGPTDIISKMEGRGK